MPGGMRAGGSKKFCWSENGLRWCPKGDEGVLLKATGECRALLFGLRGRCAPEESLTLGRKLFLCCL